MYSSSVWAFPPTGPVAHTVAAPVHAAMPCCNARVRAASGVFASNVKAQRFPRRGVQLGKAFVLGCGHKWKRLAGPGKLNSGGRNDWYSENGLDIHDEIVALLTI